MGFSSTRIKAASAFLVGFIVAGVASALAAVYYVDINSSTPTAPYASWATAATNIQDAIDAASDADQILVTNGVYQTGGRVVYGSQTNRVALTNAVMLLSVNGSQATTLVGAFNTRGALVGSNSVLSGFTITNGQSRGGGEHQLPAPVRRILARHAQVDGIFFEVGLQLCRAERRIGLLHERGCTGNVRRLCRDVPPLIDWRRYCE